MVKIDAGYIDNLDILILSSYSCNSVNIMIWEGVETSKTYLFSSFNMYFMYQNNALMYNRLFLPIKTLLLVIELGELD